MAKKKKSKRTVLHSSAGKKLYAVRDAKGEFEDIQTYKRAQGQDEKRKSKAELEPAATKKTTKKKVKKAKPAKKKTKKKAKKK
jgi:DNA-binding protein HU-beta